MLLCDIGNFSAKIYDNGKISHMSIEALNSYLPTQNIYYINVNSKFSPKSSKFIDIASCFEFDTAYKGLGIDRIAGCYTIENGVVVDAGSAITVDAMLENRHLGGFILPGISSYLKAYEEISPALKIPFNSQIDPNAIPQKTADAVTYGVVMPIILSIKDIAKNQKIFFTGGDGSFFAKFFDNAIFDKNLVFRGMLKAIKQKDLK
ncbi:type III pantothenate kinase [Campylobacter geochelonis]|uniref:Type III pantothenate kinase n=1 Tax=Campylobacter geochelonis TaxID=1780362 RepID=A0A128EPP6_9BACT|nr:type III pantothenate kinase [Campylobacter geochelonis]QKF71876.1 pantothenate kinase, type III [Campylobacter geochelonis]CZE47064.1 pantothenate kinase [Campylobacter geochelonis]CZE47358.1 pantothenate kinase [Campylobacter geochelonis]CZE50982.1 pantothenate kinase [Campylobacter geochelonis]